jgi:phosphoribosylanthranilate isomerase
LRTRVKICGITRPQDAMSAVKHGADAIGLVFYAPSPRCVSIETAKSIVQALPPFVTVVGLFVNAEESDVRQVLAQVHLDVLQFHGDEAVSYCEQFNAPYYKAIRVKKDSNLLQCAQQYSSAQALLLDAFSEQAYGGTGLVFDWGLIPTNLGKPVVLAGGLDAKNVSDAIQQIRPYAVDVSGGVETTKGIKDDGKIAAFMQAVDQFRS